MINWQAVQALAELVAAAGVIVSLLYLAAQVRQNTASLRAASARAAADHLAASNMSIVSNWRLLEAIIIANRDSWAVLGDAERLALDVYMNAFLRHHEDLFFQHEAGMIDDRVFNTHACHMRVALSGGWVREHWRRTAQLYGEDYRRWIDWLCAEAEAEVQVPPGGSTVA